jgi:glycosyltransferase involved in cell wall biosynthesis
LIDTSEEWVLYGFPLPTFLSEGVSFLARSNLETDSAVNFDIAGAICYSLNVHSSKLPKYYSARELAGTKMSIRLRAGSMRNKEKRDLYLKVHEEAAALINNLHAVLFAAFIAGFASAILSIILKFNDFDEIFKYPTVIVVPVALWLIFLVFIILITAIFIVSISSGFRMLQIEIAIQDDPLPCGEIENFISVNKSSRTKRFLTRVYYPGLYYSGYTHSYFNLIAIMTVMVAILLMLIQYKVITSAYAPPYPSSYFWLYEYVSDHNIRLVITSGLIFLLFCVIIIPRLIPNTKRLAATIKDAELLIISETLHHLHGTEIFIVGFARYAINAGHKILLVGPRENKNDVLLKTCRHDGIPLVQLPSFRTWFLGQPDFSIANPSFLRRLITAEVKVVFINGFPGPLSICALFLGRLRKKKIVFFYHVYLPIFTECIPLIGKWQLTKRVFNGLTRAFSNRCDLVIVPSASVCNEMVICGVDGSRIKIIPTGVDKYFSIPPADMEIRRIRIQYSSPILLNVGRLSQEKNVQLLLRSFAVLVEKYPSAILIIVGDGPVRNQLRLLAMNLNITRSVKFYGYLDWPRLKSLYWAADIFCMTSLGETQGLCIQEAKACNRPCVVLNSVGSRDQIENEVDGLLVDKGNTELETINLYASAIDRVLSEKDLAQIMAKRARVNALKRTSNESSQELIDAIEVL